MTIAIIGMGLIGGSIGLATRARGAGRVVAFDANLAIAQEAVRIGAADSAAESFPEAVAQADLVVLAAPPAQIIELLLLLAECLAPHAIATDVGSVKRPIAEAARSLLPERFVPSHPMAGREVHGLGAALPTLFEGATWAITPLETSAPQAVERVTQFVESLGAHSLCLTPERHDSIVAVTSHGPHVLAYALYALARDRALSEPELFALAAGGFHSTTRVAASAPTLWTQICLANREPVIDVLRGLQGRVDLAIAALEAGDEAALNTLFTQGHRD
ncbi:MAG: prephenate dehydrogenase/arogenate dehydrogenase family protein [Armatimonas sp.]